MYVIYESMSDEIIISTLEDEHKVLAEYFGEGDRDIDEYDRTTSTDPIMISPSLSWEGS